MAKPDSSVLAYAAEIEFLHLTTVVNLRIGTMSFMEGICLRRAAIEGSFSHGIVMGIALNTRGLYEMDP